MQQYGQQLEWHVASWGFWGWAETVLKLVGIGAGLLAFAGSNPAAPLTIGDNPHLAAVLLCAILVLFALVQVAIRYSQREVVSMVFAVLNLVGIVGLFVALLRVPDQTTLPIIYGVFYTLGQLTKVQFMRVTGYSEAGVNSQTMIRATWIMTIPYVLLVIFVVL
jgi:hypothetical protein